MHITIIGSNTLNGIKLRKTIIKISNMTDKKVTINLIEGKELTELPILYLDNILISKGILLKEKQIINIIKKYHKL